MQLHKFSVVGLIEPFMCTRPRRKQSTDTNADPRALLLAIVAANRSAACWKHLANCEWFYADVVSRAVFIGLTPIFCYNFTILSLNASSLRAGDAFFLLLLYFATSFFDMGAMQVKAHNDRVALLTSDNDIHITQMVK